MCGSGIAEVMGSNLIFFRVLLSNCLSWKFNCDDHPSLSESLLFNFWFGTILECASCLPVSWGFNLTKQRGGASKQQKKREGSPLHVERTWKLMLFPVRACIASLVSFLFALFLQNVRIPQNATTSVVYGN